MADLLLCPMCGYEPTLQTEEASSVQNGDGSTTSSPQHWYVVCDARFGGCGCSGGERHSPEAALAAWSRRPAGTQLLEVPSLEDLCTLTAAEWESLATNAEAELAAISATLPGTTYMDPPDGGAPTLAVQVARMARDAARYLWLCEQDFSDPIFIATGCNGTWGECGHSSFGGFRDIADSQIDAAMAAAGANGGQRP